MKAEKKKNTLMYIYAGSRNSFHIDKVNWFGNPVEKLAYYIF